MVPKSLPDSPAKVSSKRIQAWSTQNKKAPAINAAAWKFM
jgi:hypothetical protein